MFASFFRGSLRQRSSSVVTHPYRLVLGQPVSCRLASVMAKGSLSSRSKGQFDDRRQNMQIMFVATCALLLAVGNALVPPQKAQTLRARPLAAAEGSAAADAKKRIARLQCLRQGSTSTHIQNTTTPKKHVQQIQCSHPVAPLSAAAETGNTQQETHTGRRRQRHGRPAPRRALRRQARGAGRF